MEKKGLVVDLWGSWVCLWEMTEGGDGVKEAKGVMRNDWGGDGVQEAKGKMRRFVGESFRTFKEEEESNCYSWSLNMSGKKKKSVFNY